MIERALVWLKRPYALGAAVGLSAVFIGTAAAVFVVWVVADFSSTNRVAAVGDAFGFGVFMLAAFAAVFAVIAFAQSFQKADLTIDWDWRPARDPSTVLAKHSPVFPRDPGVRTPVLRVDNIDLVPLEDVTLELSVGNKGDAAAKFVAVVFCLEGIYFDAPPTESGMDAVPWNPDDGSVWKFFVRDEGWEIQWQGGTKAPVYPWADRPWDSSIKLTGMWARPTIDHTGWGGVFAVADYLKKARPETLEAEVASPPGAVAGAPPPTAAKQ